MAKLLLLSAVIALIAIPLFASREKHPSRALKRAIVATVLFNVVYTLAALYLYPVIAKR